MCTARLNIGSIRLPDIPLVVLLVAFDMPDLMDDDLLMGASSSETSEVAADAGNEDDPPVMDVEGDMGADDGRLGVAGDCNFTSRSSAGELPKDE